jgi:RNA polymerase sigma-70 factor, ECF subfamily
MSDRRREFDRVAMTHLTELLRVAMRLTGTREAAEDLVQDTYLQAWRSFDRFEAGTNCRAWLFKILLYKQSNSRRDQSRRPIVTNFESTEESALLFEPPTPDVITASSVRAAFDALPEAFRTTVLLVDVEGFTYREVAEMLGVPIGTVMSRLSRGRRLMRLELVNQAAALGVGDLGRNRGRGTLK